MILKTFNLKGIIIALTFYLFNPPLTGGSQADLNSMGYDWKNNYLSNRFNSLQ